MHNEPSLSEHYPDLLADQDDPTLRELVADLEMLHTFHPLPARLARPLESEQPLVFEQPAGLIEPLPGTLLQRVSWRRARWARWNALAAVLVTMFLLAALIGTFSQARFSKITPAQPAQPTRPAPCVSSAAARLGISSLHMSTASAGWATGRDPHNTVQDELLHTSDGGCHWKIVSPPGHGALILKTVQYISEQVLWGIVGSDGRHQAYFARTTNGGRSWQFVPIQAPGGHLTSAQIFQANVFASFWSTEEGRLLTVSYTSSAGGLAAFSLFQTSDGGLNWSQVAFDPSPLRIRWAYYTGVTFLNQSTGWVTANMGGKAPGLFVTHDGGLTWSQQKLLLPRDMGAPVAGTFLRPPRFFSKREGMLSLSSWSWSGMAIYVTHDAGATWQSAPFLRISRYPSSWGTLDIAQPAPEFQFVAPDFSWIWTGVLYQPRNNLIITRDEGQHWSYLSVPFTSGYLCGLADFVSATRGWLICTLSAAQSSAPSLLFQTYDGGKSWQRVDYMLA